MKGEMLEKTKAAFRAIREECGMTQHDIADEAGVDVRSVKRWENPAVEGYMPPDEVWSFLLSCRGALHQDAREIADQIIDSIKATNGKTVTLQYFRTQEDLDAVQLKDGIDEPVGYNNARTRLIAQHLEQAEIPYNYQYK